MQRVYYEEARRAAAAPPASGKVRDVELRSRRFMLEVDAREGASPSHIGGRIVAASRSALKASLGPGSRAPYIQLEVEAEGELQVALAAAYAAAFGQDFAE